MPRLPVAPRLDNAYLLLTLTMLFWAGNFVLGRGVHGHVPPIALAWCRWTLAFLIILPFALPHLRRDWPALRAKSGTLLLLGTVGIGCFNTFSYIGLNHTTALNGLVFQASCPFLIVLASFLFFGDRISLRQGAGIVISLAGVLVIIARGDLDVLLALQLNEGDAWLFAAFTGWAIYTAFLRQRPDVHMFSFLAATFLIGAAVNTPFFVAEHLSGWRLQPTRSTVLAVLYVAVFPSVVAQIFYNRGVELIGGNRAGTFIYLVPLFGALLAIGLLGETLEAYHVAGVALILPGIMLAARRA